MAGFGLGLSARAGLIRRVASFGGADWVAQPLDDAWIVDTNPPGPPGSASVVNSEILLDGTDASYGARAYRTFNFPAGTLVRLTFDLVDLAANTRVGNTASGTEFAPNVQHNPGTGITVEWTANGQDQFFRFNRLNAGVATIRNLKLATKARVFAHDFPDASVILDPSDLTTMWQDSIMSAPVTAAGQPVGLVLDISGNGNHWRQTVDAERPTYQTDGLLHWLEFDGVDDRLHIDNTPLLKEAVIGFRMLTGTAENAPLLSGPDESGNYVFARTQPGSDYTISVDGTNNPTGGVAVNGSAYFTGANISVPGFVPIPENQSAVTSFYLTTPWAVSQLARFTITGTMHKHPSRFYGVAARDTRFTAGELTTLNNLLNLRSGL